MTWRAGKDCPHLWANRGFTGSGRRRQMCLHCLRYRVIVPPPDVKDRAAVERWLDSGS